MAVLRELLARFGVQFDDHELQKGSASLDTLADRIRNFAGVAAAVGLGVGIGSFINSIREAGTEISQVSRQMGLSTRALQEWRFVVADAGLEAGDLFGGFGAIADNAANAAGGSKDMADAFKALGVEVKDSSGNLKGIEQLVLEMADGFSKLTNETQKSNIAQTIAGDDGLRLLAVFRQGRAGIEALRKEFARLGGGMSDDAIARSNELTAAMASVNAAFNGIRSLIAVAVFPALTRFANGVASAVGRLVELAQGTRIVEAAFLVLGAAAVALAIKIAIAFAPAILVVALWAAGIAAAIAVLDDLITLFEGGNSAIGTFIDNMLGAGTAARWVEAVKETWDAFVMVVERGNLVLDEALTLLEQIARLGLPVVSTVSNVASLFGTLGKELGLFKDSAEAGSEFLGLDPRAVTSSPESRPFSESADDPTLASSVERSAEPARSLERSVSIDNTRGGNTSRTLNQSNTITIHAPRASSGDAEDMRSAVADALEQENQKALAALVPEGA